MNEKIMHKNAARVCLSLIAYFNMKYAKGIVQTGERKKSSITLIKWPSITANAYAMFVIPPTSAYNQK